MNGAPEWQHMTDRERIVRLEERVSSMEAARRLQATEYERRLEALNHENARLARDAAIYTRQDVVYPRLDNVEGLMAALKDELDDELGSIDKRVTSTEARTAANRFLFGLVVTILGATIGILTFVISNT